jgi:hypothetical protein
MKERAWSIGMLLWIPRPETGLGMTARQSERLMQGPASQFSEKVENCSVIKWRTR